MLTSAPPAPQDTWRDTREHRVGLELHRAVAEKARTHPEILNRVVPVQLERMRAKFTYDLAARWLDTWETAWRSGPDALARVVETPGNDGDDLRQMSPFTGVLTNAERNAAIKKAMAR